ncbi:endonuclease III domain-containing protein [bacterium]|nr:endonuclease III domain-containing protein [bacterium]
MEIKSKKGNITRSIQHDGDLIRIYHLLFKRFGPQRWWPGETPFEVVVGAILTQNTAWTNVARAIHNLKNAGCLEPQSLYQIDIYRLSELIRPSGYYNIKGRRLKVFIDHLFESHEGNLERMFGQETNILREELLGIKGIGPETADSIMLYAANKPVFVVDAYTKRIFSRHGFFPVTWGYNVVQSFFMDFLPHNIKIYNEYHALIVRLAKEHCKKKPVCFKCPLEDLKDKNLS